MLLAFCTNCGLFILQIVSYESQECCEPRFPSFTPARQSCCCQRQTSGTLCLCSKRLRIDCKETRRPLPQDDVLNAVGPLPQTMQPKTRTRTKMPIKMKTVTKHKGHQLANSLVLGFQFVHCLLPIDNDSISC